MFSHVLAADHAAIHAVALELRIVRHELIVATGVPRIVPGLFPDFFPDCSPNFSTIVPRIVLGIVRQLFPIRRTTH